MDDNIIRIMVSTDNHLGYSERDPVRCDDSFASFEEMLHKSREEKVDFILLAGDLFHENKPSRRTLFIAMELFRKYSLGPDPIYTEILNDQGEIFRSNQGIVNYEDPYLSVSLPIYAIHGNHDDPSREGGQGDALSALDLLSVNNIVNYFGKTDKVDDIEITPILIKKGNTFVAIYGLGAIRDERLNRMWNLRKVKFVRPIKENDGDKFFNIFVLHQNRDYGRGKKNCVHESMIPEWIDLVIWGNEHECKPYLAESLVGTFRIFQPGSSVACSLSEIESSMFPKHYGLIEIRHDKKFRMTPKRYTEIRPFIYRDVSLQEFNELSLHDPKVEEKIKSCLTRIVLDMIDEAKDMVEEVISKRIPELHYHIKDPSQVLIRLRVDPVGLPIINQQRFGSQFVGKVANPPDILLYARKRKETFRAAAIPMTNRNNSDENNENDENENENEMIRISFEDDEYDQGLIGDIHKIKVEELIVQALESSNRNLSIMPEGELGSALEDYVKRKHANAFIDAVNETLKQTQEELFKSCSSIFHEEIVDATKRMKEKNEDLIKKGTKQKQYNNKKIIYSDDEDNNDHDHDNDGTIPTMESDEERNGEKKNKNSKTAINKSKKSTVAVVVAAAAINTTTRTGTKSTRGRGAGSNSSRGRGRATASSVSSVLVSLGRESKATTSSKTNKKKNDFLMVRDDDIDGDDDYDDNDNNNNDIIVLSSSSSSYKSNHLPQKRPATASVISLLDKDNDDRNGEDDFAGPNSRKNDNSNDIDSSEWD